MHLQQLWMILAGWPVTDRIGIADGNRIGGSRPDDAPVLDEHRRHAIAGRRHDERVIEPDVVRAWGDVGVPVRSALLAQPQMPFSDHARGIAAAPQHRW